MRVFFIGICGTAMGNAAILLKKQGHINFWVNSSNYNIVEMTHHIWLVSLSDYLAKK